VELKMTGPEQGFIVSTALLQTRSASGSVVVAFTAGRTYLEKATISVVLRDQDEAGDHAYEIRLKDSVDENKVR
jgi:hypothetical protein